MTSAQLITLGLLALASLCIAFIVLYGLAYIAGRRENKDRITIGTDDQEIVFLFDDEKLVNATKTAKQVLSSAPDVGSDWSRLLSVLISRFPSLQSEIHELAEKGTLAIDSRDGTSVLRCEWRNGLARITLLDSGTQNIPLDLDRHALQAMEQELETLRTTAMQVPFLIWRELEDGSISWANAAYLELADQVSGTDIPSWPPASLFDTSRLTSTKLDELQRLPIRSDEKPQRWFDIYKRPVDDGFLYSATSAEKTVRAEETLREFTQTLTKTFSHLTIGLAVFDKSRHLALFNPALTDLTNLPIDFLIGKPALTSFLDRLRDGQMMPEPKDYKSWRQEMAALESAAADGTYEEVWTLPGGMTYRVSGRPHPDGAVAFLFEDISAEMSLTRRFRAEIETAQSVFDSLDEAIAVFSGEGTLLMTNSAYNSLWGLDPLDEVKETSIMDATRTWHSKCAPSPIWNDIRDFVGRLGERTGWTGTTRLWDGRRLNCRFVPLGSGQTLVGFTPEVASSRLRPILRPQAENKNFVEM